MVGYGGAISHSEIQIHFGIFGKKLEYYYFGKKLAKQIIQNRNQKKFYFI